MHLFDVYVGFTLVTLILTKRIIFLIVIKEII